MHFAQREWGPDSRLPEVNSSEWQVQGRPLVQRKPGSKGPIVYSITEA